MFKLITQEDRVDRDEENFDEVSDDSHYCESDGARG